ncbi:MAG: hypothetical protein ACE5KE_13860 [Methanosarcinales archaeon]
MIEKYYCLKFQDKENFVLEMQCGGCAAPNCSNYKNRKCFPASIPLEWYADVPNPPTV